MLIQDIKPPYKHKVKFTSIDDWKFTDDIMLYDFEAQRIIDLRYDLYHEGEIHKCKYSDNTVHPRNIKSIISNLTKHSQKLKPHKD